jgi:hypothetical protein
MACVDLRFNTLSDMTKRFKHNGCLDNGDPWLNIQHPFVGLQMLTSKASQGLLVTILPSALPHAAGLEPS